MGKVIDNSILLVSNPRHFKISPVTRRQADSDPRGTHTLSHSQTTTEINRQSIVDHPIIEYRYNAFNPWTIYSIKSIDTTKRPGITPHSTPRSISIQIKKINSRIHQHCKVLISYFQAFFELLRRIHHRYYY
mmetsp:Transcript_12989/g.27484  ORF Transcript_12989/g.27484 Transcript_12989/m.27484 type:complete len:132 (-) Transcript_12989:603-998(-)